MSRRIAIVEDEPVIRANYADVLKKQGYEVAARVLRTRSSPTFAYDPGFAASRSAKVLTR